MRITSFGNQVTGDRAIDRRTYDRRRLLPPAGVRRISVWNVAVDVDGKTFAALGAGNAITQVKVAHLAVPTAFAANIEAHRSTWHQYTPWKDKRADFGKTTNGKTPAGLAIHPSNEKDPRQAPGVQDSVD
jgi:hypothetical protein